MKNKLLSDQDLLTIIKEQSSLDKDVYNYIIVENNSVWIIVEIQDATYKNEGLGKLYLNLQNQEYQYDVYDMENFNDFCHFDEEAISCLMQIRNLAKHLLSFIRLLKSANQS